MDSLLFKHPTFGEIRAAGTPDQPLFCANDVCTALGYSNPRDAINRHVDDPDVVKRDIGVQTGVKADGTPAIQTVSTNFVNESGLYALIFGSTLDTAKEFKRWVTSEVLPSIRKSGGYMAASPEETPEQIMARALKIANETVSRLETVNRELEERVKALEQNRSKATAPDPFLEGEDPKRTFTLTQASILLGFPNVLSFCDWGRNNGIFRTRRGKVIPRRTFSDMGYFSKSCNFFVDRWGNPLFSDTTIVTLKGLAFLRMLQRREKGDTTL